jgi:hypothetical protein
MEPLVAAAEFPGWIPALGGGLSVVALAATVAVAGIAAWESGVPAPLAGRSADVIRGQRP